MKVYGLYYLLFSKFNNKNLLVYCSTNQNGQGNQPAQPTQQGQGHQESSFRSDGANVAFLRKD